MALDEWLATVDALLLRPFPGGSGYHVARLLASRDFWDDRGAEVVEPAVAEIEAARDALGAVFTERWGAPVTVDLDPFAETETVTGTETETEGEQPAPLTELSAMSESVLIWRPPGGARWVGLAVGQHDREFPIELVATVAETPIA